MAENNDQNEPQIETLSDDDLDSISGGSPVAGDNTGTGVCLSNTGTGTCSANS